jgi:hypothetical protein
VIEILGALAKLMDDVSSGTGDLSQLLKQLSSDVQDIRRTVTRIEVFLNRLPLVIDATVEEKFADYVNNRLRASTQMYLEIRIGLLGGTDIPPTIRSRLDSIYNEIGRDSRVIMSYGTAAASVLAINVSVEDDCAKLLGIGKPFRKAALQTLSDYFSRVLTGGAHPPAPESIDGYLHILSNAVDEFNSYITSHLDQTFSSAERLGAYEWRLVGTGGGKSGRYRIYKRTHYLAKVLGNSNKGFTYQETSTREEQKKEAIEDKVAGGEQILSPRFRADALSVRTDQLFRRDLAAELTDVEYANDILAKRVELLGTQKHLTALKSVFDAAMSRTRSRISKLN